MSDTLLAAIVGAITGVITGTIASIFAPWAHWGIEKRKQKLNYRRELVAKWRAMLEEGAKQELGRDDSKLVMFLEKHKDYYSLVSHIPTGGDNYQLYRKDTASLTVPIFLLYLADNISKIEREWDLI